MKKAHGIKGVIILILGFIILGFIGLSMSINQTGYKNKQKIDYQGEMISVSQTGNDNFLMTMAQSSSIKTLQVEDKALLTETFGLSEEPSSVLDVFIILLVVVIGLEIMAIVLKKQNNRLRLKSVILPLLLFGISEKQSVEIIMILFGIIAILFLYLMYLFVSAPQLKRVETKKIKTYKNKETYDYHTNEKEVLNQVIETSDEGIQTTYDYSFEANMHQTTLTLQKLYGMIKNYILSYPDIKVKKCWYYEHYLYHGKLMLKVSLQEQCIKLYYDLDPKVFKESDYQVKDASYTKAHHTTPTLLIVSDEHSLDYAKALIDIYMDEKEVKGLTPTIDYTVKYYSREELISKNLIKVRTQI